ncbi:hypothetical protein RRG08_000521 [Elysia crispata]|uniref:Uncharacterized protein n=1 Tax=Elysia crispata TaxID=231223 RepID=A0AAE0YCF9_9GAST|nr:hypothetical protein RRG08_000521 [Elysia crispata]
MVDLWGCSPGQYNRKPVWRVCAPPAQPPASRAQWEIPETAEEGEERSEEGARESGFKRLGHIIRLR